MQINPLHIYAYIFIFIYFIRGKQITCPGARDKLNFRQDKHIFSPNVRQTSKKLNASIFFLDKDKLFGNRTSKNLMDLPAGQVKIFRFFYPCLYTLTPLP